MGFAKENLKPLCSPTNIELCDEKKKEMIADLQAMSNHDLTSLIAQLEAEIQKVADNFDKEVEKLQEKYEELEKEKDKKTKELKDSGLGLMKAVLATKGPKSEL